VAAAAAFAAVASALCSAAVRSAADTACEAVDNISQITKSGEGQKNFASTNMKAPGLSPNSYGLSASMTNFGSMQDPSGVLHETHQTDLIEPDILVEKILKLHRNSIINGCTLLLCSPHWLS
jgi:hypothetical protein